MTGKTAMLTLNITFREEGHKELVVSSDKDWSIDRESAYLIVAAVDGSRHIIPLDVIHHLHIVGKADR